MVYYIDVLRNGRVLKCLLLVVVEPLRAGTLDVTIIDETGSRCPARVYLTDAANRAEFPQGTIIYDKSREELSERYFVPTAGTFRIELVPGKYAIRVERGKEYLPEQKTIDVPASGMVQQRLQLRRWTKMSDRGWYSADMHAHGQLQDMPVLQLAEDLNVVLPITRWRSMMQPVRSDPDLAAFLDGSDTAGTFHAGKNRLIPVLNEELESHWAALLVSHLDRSNLPLEYPLAKYGMAAHTREAVVDSEKATSYELPVIAAVGACNFVGLANNHFWRAGYHSFQWGTYPNNVPRRYPDSCTGYASAGFDTYYALLNMGFPLKLSAGSANGVHPVPMGWSRVYAHVYGEFTAQAWFDALKKGRTFVTTGPMLLLRANGLEPGDEDRGTWLHKEIEAEVTLLSPTPVRDVAIVINGAERRLSLAPDTEHRHSYRGRLRIDLKSSSWIAARWVGEQAGNCSIAHTAPVYFWNGDQPIQIPRADAAYLLGRVEQLISEVQTGRSVDGLQPTTVMSGTEQLRREQLQLLEEARQVYRGKLAQSH